MFLRGSGQVLPQYPLSLPFARQLSRGESFFTVRRMGVLALSVTSGDSSPKGGVLGIIADFIALPKPIPLGRGGTAQAVTERVCSPLTMPLAVPTEGFPRSGEAVEARSDETDEGAPADAAGGYSPLIRHFVPPLPAERNPRSCCAACKSKNTTHFCVVLLLVEITGLLRSR